MSSSKIQSENREHLRAISWWLTYDDFRWPDPDIADKIKRKADNMVRSGCNLAMLFGAHWRWDWLPVWTMLHDLIAAIADELHERGIRVMDHHSAVLAQRYHSVDDLRRIRLRHPHHISPAPTFEIGASWEFDGQKLDDWRMRDVRDGAVCIQSMYDTVEFCMNHPGFVEAYRKYVRKLFAETGIDGLQCDDGMFYSRFSSCGCTHCRTRFRDEYGFELPPADDAGFWGDWSNPAWRRWIDLRYRSAGDFLARVRTAMPAGAGLCTCLSGPIHVAGNATGQGPEMIDQCNVLMLEMCKNMPDLDGNPTRPMPSQLYQLAKAAKRGLPVMSCGYGYTTATADVVWAFSKFLGADSWLSTNKGRLSLRFSDWDRLPDDTELPGRGYRYERDHRTLFDTCPEADVLVYFSEASRRYYGGGANDYVRDYQEAIWKLFRAGYSVGAAAEIPAPGTAAALMLSSAGAMSESEREAVAAFAAAGGKVLLTGPCGLLDGTGAPTGQFTAQWGLHQQLSAQLRQQEFPIDWFIAEPQRVLNPAQWTELSPNLFYHPGRMQDDSPPDVTAILGMPPAVAPGWFLRRHRDRAGNLLIHGFAAEFDLGFAAAVEALRIPEAPWSNRIIDRVAPRNTARRLEFRLTDARVELFTPLNAQPGSVRSRSGAVEINLPEECFYFIVKATSIAQKGE